MTMSLNKLWESKSETKIFYILHLSGGGPWKGRASIETHRAYVFINAGLEKHCSQIEFFGSHKCGW